MSSDNVQSKVLLQLPNIELHRLTGKTRSAFSSGVLRICQLSKPNKQQIHFLNLNSFYYTITKSTVFIKVVYKKNISYVYPHFDSGLSSITVQLGEVNIGRFEEVLRRVATLLAYEQAMEVDSLKQKIMAHCPDLKDNEIVVSDRLQHVINTGGHYAEKGFKWVGSFISLGVAKVGGFFGERVEPTGPTQKSEAAKTKFNELKEGTEKILSAGGKYISKVVEPVVAKGKEVVGSISTKIDNSSSDNVKYLKEIGTTTAGAVKHALNGVVSAVTQVSTTVTSTTKQLWQKKYGNKEEAPTGNELKQPEIPQQKIPDQIPYIPIQTKDSERVPQIQQPPYIEIPTNEENKQQ